QTSQDQTRCVERTSLTLHVRILYLARTTSPAQIHKACSFRYRMRLHRSLRCGAGRYSQLQTNVRAHRQTSGIGDLLVLTGKLHLSENRAFAVSQLSQVHIMPALAARLYTRGHRTHARDEHFLDCVAIAE